MAKPRYPNHSINPTAFEVASQLDANDRFDPRIIDVRLSDEAPGLIVMANRDREEQQVVFMAEQWPSLREAIDRLVTHASQKPARNRR